MQQYKTFQMNMPGYDSSSDQTEDLVKWINAPNIKIAILFAEKIGAEIESVEEISFHETEGIDFYLDKNGEICNEY